MLDPQPRPALFPYTTLFRSPQITMGKFANGMSYYIRANKKPEKRAELRLVVKAGSILEDDDQQGLAHLVEHMAFNGTKDRKSTRLNSSHLGISYAVFCLKKK